MMNELEPGTSFGCDGCSMVNTSVCGDCLVTFLCRDDPVADDAVVLDLAEHRAVRRLQAAGLLPEWRYQSGVG